MSNTKRLIHLDFSGVRNYPSSNYVDHLEITQSWHERGAYVVPLHPRSKKPKKKGWPKLRITPDDVDKYFQPKDNIGLLLGEPSAWIVDVDLDLDECCLVAPHIFPATYTFGHSARPSSHFFYKSVGAKTRKFSISEIDEIDDDLGVVAEIRSSGAQTCLPSSIHPKSKSPYKVQRDAPPAELCCEELNQLVLQTVIAGLLLRYYPRQGSRHDYIHACTGALLHYQIVESVVERIIHAVILANSGEAEQADRFNTVANTIEHFETGDNIQGFTTLLDHIPKAVVQALRRWAGELSEGESLLNRSSSYLRSVQASDIEPEKIDWLWEGRIAKGKITVIGGDPGTGKSLLALDIAACVSLGDRWPDESQANVGETLLISGEDGVADTIVPRLHAIGADTTKIRIAEDIQTTGTTTNTLFTIRNNLEELGEYLGHRENVDLIVIDPISAFLGGVDSHKDADVRALMAPLAQLAAKHNVAIVCVAHMNKSMQSQAIYRVGGSIAWVALARAAYLVVKDPDEKSRRLLLPVKNNLGNDSIGFAYTIEEDESGAPFVVWEEGGVLESVDTLLNAGHSEERSKLKIAQDFIEEELADGEKAADELYQSADMEGIAEITLVRASRQLGVVKRKTKGNRGNWVWSMPVSQA